MVVKEIQMLCFIHRYSEWMNNIILNLRNGKIKMAEYLICFQELVLQILISFKQSKKIVEKFLDFRFGKFRIFCLFHFDYLIFYFECLHKFFIYYIVFTIKIYRMSFLILRFFLFKINFIMKYFYIKIVFFFPFFI